MDQPGPSQPSPENSEPAHYSLEVIRVESGRRLSAEGQPYVVEIKVNSVTRKVVDIGDDGTPSSDAGLSFSQSDVSSKFKVSVKRVGSERSLGRTTVNIAKRLQRSATYEFSCELTRTSLASRILSVGEPAIRVHLCLRVVDAMAAAEKCVTLAEDCIKQIDGWANKVESASFVIGNVIVALKDAMDAVDEVAHAHSFLKLSWRTVSVVATLVLRQFDNDVEVKLMVEAMKDAFGFSREAEKLDDKTERLKPIIKELLHEMINFSLFVKGYAKRGFPVRVIRPGDSRGIKEHKDRFIELKKKLDSSIGLNTATTVMDIASRQVLEELVDPAKVDISKMSTRARCLERTREDYLKEIMSKLFAGVEGDGNIIWLTGVAGAGKSTIAATISEKCNDKGSPAAYVFFERGKDEYISAIRAIAYRVATLYPAVRPYIVDAVRKNGNVKGSPVKTQFEKLLLEPIQVAKGDIERPIVIILDALDECGTSAQREDFVSLLTSDSWKPLSKVRVLVTSRLEDDILRHLSSKDHIYRIELENTSQESRQDVDIYIEKMMIDAVGQVPPEGWEWDGICKVLSEAADGLFIWASTAVKMVADSHNRRRKLRMLLGDIKSVGGGIDGLYATLLEHSGIRWHEAEAEDEFARILGVILFAKEAMSGEDIESFLGLEKDAVDSILSWLRSVLFYEAGKPVRLHHASFADYLASKRSSGKPWNVDESVQRLTIAERSFDIMIEKLHFNICGIESSFLRNDAIPDLQDRIQKTISRHLHYACRFWSVHFCELLHPDSLLEKLKTFANSKLLYWFEVVSLTKYYNRVAAGALYNASLKTASINSDLSSFLWAAYRLASAFGYPISQSAPQIYLAAISLWKGESLVGDHYATSHLTVRVERYGKKAPAQCIKVLTGHADLVFSDAFSLDGKRIVSGSRDGTVRVWDADSGEVVSGPFGGYSGDVNSVTFSPDGKLVASGYNNCTVCVWDIDNGELFSGPLKGHADWVSSVAFSPDGKRIASGSEDKTIRVWDAESGEPVGNPFEGHIGSISSVVFSPNGKHIASGSRDKTIRVWDSESGELFAGPLEGHTFGVLSIYFSPDGWRIASGSADWQIRIWDVRTGEQVVRPIEGHTNWVSSVVFSPDGKRITSGSHDQTICVWGADSGELVAGPFKEHSGDVWSVAFSPDGKRIVSGSGDATIRVWDTESGKSNPDEFEERLGPINSIAFSQNGKHITSGSNNHTICVWDAESGELVSSPCKGHTDSVTSVAYSLDGKRIVSGSDDKTVCVWDAVSGELVSDPFKGHSGRVLSVVFSPNGKLVASGSTDGTIRVWHVDVGDLVAEPFTGHIGPIYSVSFSPDGGSIASGSYDKTIRVWDVGSGKLASGPFVGHTGSIRSVTFSPNGKLIASGSDDHTIRVWSVDRIDSDPLSNPIRGHTDSVQSVAFSLDGGFIASGSADKSIYIWNADSGQLAWGPLKGHTDWVRSVVFSPNGKYLASGSLDGTIRVWSLNISGLKAFSHGGRSLNIASHDQSSRVEKEGIISNWSLSDDGWVLGPGGELLTWVPEDMRLTLLVPEITIVIGLGFSTRLDLVNSPLGEDWCKGFKGL